MTAKTVELEDMSINQIARLIQKDWGKVNFAAIPYLDAMYALTTIDNQYGMDSGRDIVNRFLGNAGQWRGETARAVKTELKRRLKS